MGALPVAEILFIDMQKFFFRQKWLTDGQISVTISSSFIFKMRLSRKSSLKERSRELSVVQDNSEVSGEVRFASSVLNFPVGTTGATVISLRLFR